MRIGYDYAIWGEYSYKFPIDINLQTHPSILITGSSGSGKSYALKWIMRNLLTEEKVKIIFCNFKDSTDFKFLKSFPQYFTFLDCKTGIESFYNEFKVLQGSGQEFDGIYHILIFDEYPAFLLSLPEKKEVEKYKGMMAELLMSCRSYGYGVMLTMQRPDSTFLANGARDNFMSTISLGNISKEAKSMLYSGESLPDRIYQVGEGIGYIDGKGIVEIKFPKIQNMADLENQILKRLDGSDRREADGEAGAKSRSIYYKA